MGNRSQLVAHEEGPKAPTTELADRHRSSPPPLLVEFLISNMTREKSTHDVALDTHNRCVKSAVLHNQALAVGILTSLSRMPSDFLSPKKQSKCFSAEEAIPRKIPEFLGISNGCLATETRHWMLLLMLWASILI